VVDESQRQFNDQGASSRSKDKFSGKLLCLFISFKDQHDLDRMVIVQLHSDVFWLMFGIDTLKSFVLSRAFLDYFKR
jgi:hypothetical protein